MEENNNDQMAIPLIGLCVVREIMEVNKNAKW
jgi:hypothetical protein